MEHQQQDTENTDRDDQSPPVEQQVTKFVEVNEDCILNVLQYLSLMDLCSLAETCTRFQDIVRRAFPKNLHIRIYNNECCYIDSRKDSRSESRPLSDIERVLKHSPNSLETLSCLGSLPVGLTGKLKPLKLLELNHCYITYDKTLFADLNSLIELRLLFASNCGAILRNHFPKLERFRYGGIDLIDEHLPNFLSRHTSLKSLELDPQIRDESPKTALLQVVVNRCKELEELKLKFEGGTSASSLQPLQALQSLKMLKLWRVSFKDLKLLAALTQLRELTLDLCCLPEDLSQFAALTELRELTLTDCHLGHYPIQFAGLAQLTKLEISIGRNATRRNVDLVDTIRQLTNLEEFKFFTRRLTVWTLDEAKFAQIVAVVKGRPKLLTLKCYYEFDLNSNNFDANGNVRLIRQHW